MTTTAFMTDADHTAAEKNLLDEIQTAATVVLHLVPMDTDNPSVHLGVRALIARTNEIIESLHAIASGSRTVADLARLVPDASRLDTTRLHLELLMELDAIGNAVLAIVRASGVEPANLQLFVACLQARAGALHDEWLTAMNSSEEGPCEDETSLPPPQTSVPSLMRIV